MRCKDLPGGGGTPTASRFGTYNSVTGACSNIANPAKPTGMALTARSTSMVTPFTASTLAPARRLDSARHQFTHRRNKARPIPNQAATNRIA